MSGEQLKRFLNQAIGDERLTRIVPSGSMLQFRSITVRGDTFQLTAFRPQEGEPGRWQARITLGSLDWDTARELDYRSGVFPSADEAFDDLETRLRTALAPVLAWKTA